ncbi:Alpha beta hydrolase fold protein [Colletotrichum asianum]
MSTEPSISQGQNHNSAYDRHNIVGSIKRYYELLSKMVSIRPEHIAYPAEGGWGDDVIPLEKLRRLGFNDTMIDLARHLPYVTSRRPVFPSTQTINYFQNGFRGPDEDYQLRDPNLVGLWPLPEERIPQGIVPLSQPLGGDRLGTWRWITAHDAHISRPEEEIPENEQWRTARPVPAVEYFDGLCQDMISLEMFPVPDDSSGSEWQVWQPKWMRAHQKWVNEAQEIYRKCRWPNLQRFQRQKCRRLLIEMQDRLTAEDDEERERRSAVASEA